MTQFCFHSQLWYLFLFCVFVANAYLGNLPPDLSNLNASFSDGAYLVVNSSLAPLTLATNISFDFTSAAASGVLARHGQVLGSAVGDYVGLMLVDGNTLAFNVMLTSSQVVLC